MSDELILYIIRGIPRPSGKTYSGQETVSQNTTMPPMTTSPIRKAQLQVRCE